MVSRGGLAAGVKTPGELAGLCRSSSSDPLKSNCKREVPTREKQNPRRGTGLWRLKTAVADTKT
jgi:hypothetical protein